MNNVAVTCINLKCGLPFSVAQHVYDQAQRNKAREIWCPGCGGSFVFSESIEDRLKAKVSSLEGDVSRLRTVWNEQGARSDRLSRQVTALRGVITRLKAKR